MNIWGILFILEGSCFIIFGEYAIWQNRNYIQSYLNPKHFYLIINPIFIILQLILIFDGILRIFNNNNDSGLCPLWIILPYALLWIFGSLIISIMILAQYIDFKPLSKEIRNNGEIHPYLIPQDPFGSKIMIKWGLYRQEKIFPEKLALHYWENKENQAEISKLANIKIESFKNLQLFSATLDNLTPDSEYKYQITTNDSKSPVYQFSSPKNLKINSEFNFLVVGDLHADQNDISKEIALIKSLQFNFPFIISLGDNLSRSHKLANWMRFWKQFNPITANHLFLTCTGNHDAQQFKDAKIWHKFFPYTFSNPINGYYYKYQYGNAIFFFLDLYNAGKQPRIPSEIQMNWLKTELEQIEKESNKLIQHRILILHNPIYNTGEFGCDPDLERLLYPIIEKFHINLVISGHAHIFESYFRPFPENQKSSNKNGTTFIVNGGGGGKLDEIILKNRKFPTVPYQWDSRVHQAKSKPFLRGIKKSRFRNDYAVINYQEWGKICHSFLKISTDGKKLKISAIDWEGKVIYEKILND